MKLKDPVFLVHPRDTHFHLQSRYNLSSLYYQYQKMTGARELGEAEFIPHINSVLIRVEIHSARVATIDTVVQSRRHPALDDAVPPRDLRDGLETGALYTTVEWAS